MGNGVIDIDWLDMGFVLVPMALAFVILFRCSKRGWTALYASARMLIQLIAIGYFLVFIFDATAAWIVCLVLGAMLAIASWICLGPVDRPRRELYPHAFLALAAGGIVTLVSVTWGVLDLDPWYAPRYVVPLAGMIFANAMNTVSLAAERFEAELAGGRTLDDARRTALQTGMIPVINSMFAVGLVALPGMMTGQILSGVSPLVAVRYQIVVMCMLFAASGLSSAIYLQLAGRAGRSPAR